MTKEFKNLLNLLKSGNPDNVYLGLLLARNFREEFETYLRCSPEDYEDLYRFLVNGKIWPQNMPIKELLTEMTGLNLQNVKELPKSIKILKKVDKIRLGSNSLYELPAEIGELESLVSLRLVDNFLTKLPKEIEKLDKLLILHLNGNPFEVFPEELAGIKNLEWLGFFMEEQRQFAKEIDILKITHPDLKLADDY